MIKKIIIMILFVSIAKSAFAVHIYNEKYYQNQWCSKWHGKQEVQLKDKTRVDCITKNYAVEFDFARKWAEALGQSIHYGEMTRKKPAIILIIENKSDFKYYDRLVPLCKKFNVTLWYMKSPIYKNAMQIKYTLK